MDVRFRGGWQLGRRTDLKRQYSLGLIDVGVLILPMKDFSKTMGENIPHFERVARELPYAKMSITLPILVIGIAPQLLSQRKPRKRAKVAS